MWVGTAGVGVRSGSMAALPRETPGTLVTFVTFQIDVPRVPTARVGLGLATILLLAPATLEAMLRRSRMYWSLAALLGALFVMSSCSGGTGVDAGAGADACTSVYVPAIRGTVKDQDAAPLVPSGLEVCLEERCGDCRIEESPSEVTYDCAGFAPNVPIGDLPAVTYELRASVGGETWTFSVEVVRANNCHFESTERNLVLPP